MTESICLSLVSITGVAGGETIIEFSELIVLCTLCIIGLGSGLTVFLFYGELKAFLSEASALLTYLI